MPPIYVSNNAPRGIDLGTTFSAICWWTGREPRVYLNAGGEDVTQSVVYVSPKDGSILVGREAYRKGLVDPENMIFGVKRQMDSSTKQISLAGRDFTPVELSAEILKRVYGDMQRQFPVAAFRERPTVVTVPYYFKAHQCEHTKQAADLAGIPCISLLQEPIAASLSYGLTRAVPPGASAKVPEELILVFDLGGGTFDLTLFRLQQEKDVIRFVVIATGGNDRLGGMDFDAAIHKYLLDKTSIQLDDLPIRDRMRAEAELRQQVIEAKERLASANEWSVVVPAIRPGANMDTTLTINEMNTCLAPFMDRIERIIDSLIEGAINPITGTRLLPREITRVIPVGGSSRLRKVRELLIERFDEAKLWSNVDASLCVAEGAAMYAAYLEEPSAFPRRIEVVTATCHALGVEVAGGRFDTLIPANQPAPYSVRKRFVNHEDNITSTDINIFQGASKWVKDNTKIGTIHITGLPSRPARQLDFFVTFTVNSEQQLSVTVEVNGATYDLTIQYM